MKNQWRDRRISELPDQLQEFTVTYIPENRPSRKTVHFSFDVFGPEEERI